MSAELTIDSPDRASAGDSVQLIIRVRALETVSLHRLVLDVGWRAEGKGLHEETRILREVLRDSAVTLQPGAVRTHSVDVALPASPITYSGTLFSIRWCVHVGAWLADGELSADAFIEVHAPRR